MDQDSIITSILNNINDGVILKDEKGVIVFVNQKIEEFLGYLTHYPFNTGSGSCLFSRISHPF